jgi:succinoglycan biosynthesis protein ExoM
VTRFVLVICTRQRPGQLARALAGVQAQVLPEGASLACVVVENDSELRSGAVVGAADGPVPLIHVLEPERGLSAARNRGLDEALALGADWILTSDDDGVADPGWFAAYAWAVTAFPGIRGFIGRTIYTFPPGTPLWYPRPERTPRRTGQSPYVASTSNSCFDAGLVREGLRFDPAFGLTGGEDTDFFLRLRRIQPPLVWVDEAVVREAVIPDRARLGPILARQRRNGQTMVRVQIKAWPGLKGRLIAAHMVYRSFLFGLGALAGGLCALPLARETAQGWIGAGLMHLSHVMGMMRAAFAGPPEWYRRTDGY